MSPQRVQVLACVIAFAIIFIITWKTPMFERTGAIIMRGQAR